MLQTTRDSLETKKDPVFCNKESTSETGKTSRGQKIETFTSNTNDAAAKRKKWITIAIIVAVVAALTIATSGIALFAFLGGAAALSFAGISVASLTLPNIFAVVGGLATAFFSGAVAAIIKMRFFAKTKAVEKKDDQPIGSTSPILEKARNWPVNGFQQKALLEIFKKHSDDASIITSFDSLLIYIDGMFLRNPLKAALFDAINAIDEAKSSADIAYLTNQEPDDETSRKPTPADAAIAWPQEKKDLFIENRKKLEGSSKEADFDAAVRALPHSFHTKLEKLAKAQFTLFEIINGAEKDDTDIQERLDAIIQEHNKLALQAKALKESFANQSPKRIFC